MATETVSGRGFVTIATGDPKYYRLAVNLLHSYRLNSKDPAPFSLICDRDCPEAREFDSFVLIDEPKRSYLDKLSLAQYIPYEETIFIDADALILSDTQILWEDFADQPDFCCYGTQLPPESREGWFFYEDMGDLQPRLTYGVSMHGGLYYLRKTDSCKAIFDTALYFARHYHEYKFANFEHPADEPVLALSMALAGVKPCPIRDRIIFLPSHEGKLRADRRGGFLLRNKPCDAPILHFGNRHIPRFLYQYLLATVEHRAGGKEGPLPFSAELRLRLECLPLDAKVFIKRIFKMILPEKCVRFLVKRKKKAHKNA